MTRYYLNMIVRNEAPVICRALQSALNVFGGPGELKGVLITDTGSTDNTIQLIKDFCADNKIEHVAVHEDTWVDFATNRTEALLNARHYLTALIARTCTTIAEGAEIANSFIVFLDADEEYQLEPLGGSAVEVVPEEIPHHVNVLSAKVCMGNLRYERLIGVRAHVTGVRYESALHEYLVVPGMFKQDLPAVTIKVNTDGHRSQDPDKYSKDVQLLLRALDDLSAEDEHLRPRYAYYLAQSYKDSNQPDTARQWYKFRSEMLNTWEEEAWHAEYMACSLMPEQHAAPGQILGQAQAQAQDAIAVVAHKVQMLLKAWNRRPWRPEPLNKALRLLNAQNAHYLVIALATYYQDVHVPTAPVLTTSPAERAQNPKNQDVLFVEEDAYWRISDERALALFYTGLRSQAKGIWNSLLANVLTGQRAQQQYAADVQRILTNLSFCESA